MSRVVVIGCGHVGLVTAACLAEIGHRVVGVDNDPDKLASLRHGRTPFYEPGLAELVERHTNTALTFESDARVALEGAECAFICVGTPPRHDGHSSLAFVEQAARTVAEAASGPIVIVEKSTVPVRTARRIVDVIAQQGRSHEIEVASSPEFLREGTAVRDTLCPDRIVFGIDGAGIAEQVLRRLYAPIAESTGCPVVVTNVETAEMIKHACNSFLSTKISYINAVAELCEQMGADVELVSQAMGLDPRIGSSFLNAGVGYGGFCFPKDVSAFIAQADEVGVDFSFLRSVREINARQRTRMVDKVRRAVWNLEGKSIGVWGIAFKPGTDDLREAPAIDVIEALQAEGALVRAYDPVAGHEAKNVLLDTEIVAGAMEAAEGADALVVMTEWPEFAAVDLAALSDSMRRPVVIDGRNLWPLEDMKTNGFTYLSFGRPEVTAGEIGPAYRGRLF